jgi:hypothetical protein
MEVPCDRCPGTWTMSAAGDVEHVGSDEDGKQLLRVFLTSVEVVGGCEHAEELREKARFVT